MKWCLSKTIITKEKEGSTTYKSDKQSMCPATLYTVFLRGSQQKNKRVRGEILLPFGASGSPVSQNQDRLHWSKLCKRISHLILRHLSKNSHPHNPKFHVGARMRGATGYRAEAARAVTHEEADVGDEQLARVGTSAKRSRRRVASATTTPPLSFLPRSLPSGLNCGHAATRMRIDSSE